MDGGRLTRVGWILIALPAAGCYLYRVPLQAGQIEPAGEGTIAIAAPGADAAAGRAVPLTAAVYASAPGAGGRRALEFALLSQRDDPRRPNLSTTHYLNFELFVEPATDRIVGFNAAGVVLLARPHRDRAVLYRYSRCPEPVALQRLEDGSIRGRFVFEMTYVVALPAGDRSPLRVEVDFTAEPDPESLRRLKEGHGAAAAGLERIHLARTSRTGRGGAVDLFGDGDQDGGRP
jgi:hypothetical protein